MHLNHFRGLKRQNSLHRNTPKEKQKTFLVSQRVSQILKFSWWGHSGGLLWNVLASYLYLCYLNCPRLVGSGLIMAPFEHSWQDGLEKEKLSALSPLSMYSLSLSLLSAPCIFFSAEWSWRITQLCLNPVPSYLAPTPPTQSTQGRKRASLPLSQTPAWTHASHSKPSQYSRMGTWTVIVCLHYLCQCTDCGKWHRNAIIHSCLPALPSIRLTIFCNRPGFPGCWNHECEK